MTFQSDNVTIFEGELTEELVRRTQVVQANSTTYQPETNVLEERQTTNGINVKGILLPIHDGLGYIFATSDGAYNSTQRFSDISSQMMMTGLEKALPLTFFYPEYKGKGTSQQVYVRDMIGR